MLSWFVSVNLRWPDVRAHAWHPGMGVAVAPELNEEKYSRLKRTEKKKMEQRLVFSSDLRALNLTIGIFHLQLQACVAASHADLQAILYVARGRIQWEKKGSEYLMVKRSRPDSWQVATKNLQTCLTPGCWSRVMPLLSFHKREVGWALFRRLCPKNCSQ